MAAVLSSLLRLWPARRIIGMLVLICASGRLLHADQLPSPWADQDVGAPAVAGAASYSQGSYSVTAAGTGIAGISDQFHFVYLQVSGDVEILARVDSLLQADPESSAGVMIRSSLDAGSAEGSTLLSAANGLAFKRRPLTGSMTTSTAGENATAPRWVRLVRMGSLITAYSAADGATWTPIGSDTIESGPTVYVGLAISSHNPMAQTTAVFSNVLTIPLAILPPQQQTDIGSPALTGSGIYRLGTYVMTGSGSEDAGTEDQLHFVYQLVAGDVDLFARVASLENVSTGSRAGVMIRESLSADSRDAWVWASAGQGLAFERRIDTGGFTQSTSGGDGTAPVWVRVVRTANRLEAFRSADGQTWTSIGVDSIPMADTVYVGLAVTSDTDDQTAAAAIDGFRLMQPSGNLPPTVVLTAPAEGESYTAPATITLTAIASDPENRMARVEFYQGTTLLGTAMTTPYSFTWAFVSAGTYALSATAYDADGARATSASVNITVAENQPPTVILTTPAAGATYTAQATITLTASAWDPEDRMARVEFYQGTTLLGMATTPPYSFTWASVPPGIYALSAMAYDADGCSAMSPSMTIGVRSVDQPPPTTATFHASADHDTDVTSYLLEVFPGGADPTTDPPVASSDLGKPTPDANGDIIVGRSSFFSGLPPGTYVATASAIGPTGRGRSDPVTFVR
jgi:hypothetical protein